MALPCPRCDATLSALEVSARSSFERFVVDRCQLCGGMWIDRSELAKVCPSLSGLHERRIELEVFGKPGGDLLSCPRCGDVPSAFALLGLTIDVCMGCGGVWLDSHEHSELGASTGIRSPPGADRTLSPYRALRSAVRTERILCAHCGAATWLRDAFMCAAGLICRPCHDAELLSVEVDTSDMDTFVSSDDQGPVEALVSRVIAPLVIALGALLDGKRLADPAASATEE